MPVIADDPRRTETARNLSTQWIPILPGTDSALLAAMLHVIVEEGYSDREFVERYPVGFDESARNKSQLGNLVRVNPLQFSGRGKGRSGPGHPPNDGG